MAVSGSSFSPPLPGTGGSCARAGHYHPQACASPGCLTRSACPAAPIPAGEAQGRPLLKLYLSGPGGSHLPGSLAWSVNLSHQKEQKLAGCFWDSGKEIPFFCAFDCQTVLTRTLILMFSILYTDCGGTLACYPSAQGLEAGGSEVCHPWPHIRFKFEASLDYIRPGLKCKQTNA